MRFPKPLKKGDTIAIVAPSFGATTEPYNVRFNEAVRRFKERGYNDKIGECCYKSDGLGISTDPKTAAAGLQKYYLDPKINAVFSCGGGELMCETVSYVDFEKLKTAEPKWFIGYSDNTNFIFPLVTLCSIPAIYGQNAPGFGKPWEQSELDAWNLLEGKSFTVSGYPKFQNPDVDSEDPLSPYILTDKKELVSYIPSKNGNTLKLLPPDEKLEFDGTILGGCLDCLSILCGTKFDQVEQFNEKYKEDGILWFLESCDLNPMGIRRALWQLDEAGWLKYTKGFLIGRPYCYGEDFFGMDQYTAVLGILSKYNVPVIMDVDIGHLPPMMPLVCGSKAKVKVEGNSIKIDMAYI